MHVLIVSLVCFIINLPLGYLRAGTEKVANKLIYIHLAIPVIYLLRTHFFNISWKWIPFFIVISLISQALSGKFRKRYLIKSDE